MPQKKYILNLSCFNAGSKTFLKFKGLAPKAISWLFHLADYHLNSTVEHGKAIWVLCISKSLDLYLYFSIIFDDSSDHHLVIILGSVLWRNFSMDANTVIYVQGGLQAKWVVLEQFGISCGHMQGCKMYNCIETHLHQKKCFP